MPKERVNPIVSFMKLSSDYNKQKLANLVLAIINGLLCLSLFFLSSRAPLVIGIDQKGNKEFFESSRRELLVTETDLEDVALKFIHARYSWDKLDQGSILGSIAPFVTSNLKNKIAKELIKVAKTFPKDKEVSQAVIGIKTNVSMEKIIISFDQIIKVGGVPLITPMEIEFLMMEGSRSRLNPFGIYINNITQYETI